MPRYSRPRRTWKYDKKFKRKAVIMSLDSHRYIKDVALGLDVHPFMLSRWRTEYCEGKLGRVNQKHVEAMKKQKKTHQHKLSKVERLELENKRLKEENDLLKKWQRYLAEQHQEDLNSCKDTKPSE